MKKIISLLLLLIPVTLLAQLINLTPNANTTIVSTTLTVTPSGGNFKTYWVCSGATLYYTESSTMDTIILENGANLIFGNTSYGYATIYAKQGSTVDMNQRQTGSLKHEQGVTITDTLTPMGSFFQGTSVLVNMIVVSNSNLPQGVGCNANSISQQPLQNNTIKVYINRNGELIINNKNYKPTTHYKLMDIYGKEIKNFISNDEETTIPSNMLHAGIYVLICMSENEKQYIKFIYNH